MTEILYHKFQALVRSQEFGRASWEQQFPNVEWDLDMKTFSNYSCENISQISYNLEAAVLRQSAFFYQVSNVFLKF